MSKRTILKRIQVHEQYADGTNAVYEDHLPVRWVDFGKAGIRRKVCKTSGKSFLLLVLKHSVRLDPPLPVTKQLSLFD